MAVIIEGPDVRAAGESGAVAAGLGNQSRAAVRADVVESAYCAVLATRDQDRRAGHFDRSDDEGAGLGQLADVADLQPAPSKDGFALQLEIIVSSEERSVGKEAVSTARSRWSPYH